MPFEQESKVIEDAFMAYIAAQVNAMRKDGRSDQDMASTIYHNILIQIVDMLRYGHCFLSGRLPTPDEVESALSGAAALFRSSYAENTDISGPMMNKKDMN